MSKFFSAPVEEALKYLYYGMADGTYDGKKGKELLEHAYKRGDADAAFFLARCYSGPEFIWSGHHFQVDEELCMKLYKQSILMGSQLGLLGGIRVAGLMDDPDLAEYNTKEKLVIAYNYIHKLGDYGEPICQYMIGNVMHYGDFIKIFDIDQDHPSFQHVCRRYLVSAIPWFQAALEGGVYSAGQNLAVAYREGFFGTIPKQPEKEKEIAYHAAVELQNVAFFKIYADCCYKERDYETSLAYYLKAAEVDDYEAYYDVAYQYYMGQGIEKSPRLAKHYFEKAIDTNHPLAHLAHGYVGIVFFYGLDGVIQNRAKAFMHFERSEKQKAWVSTPEYAYCLIHGIECSTNYNKAFKLLSAYFKNATNCTDMAYLCMGIMHTKGLGTKQDIGKGVHYLEQCDMDEARAMMKQFKKNVFGFWRKG
ncbi:MAG: hypothetical protein ATN35_10950 [Epulopiscium sp. Nele67-Bin004]|nr:MAG: hypothetical protein ATN35_10950 [Epulopiscium sp. Nele67-Bin004]